jgi:hypothetical protein
LNGTPGHTPQQELMKPLGYKEIHECTRLKRTPP